MFKDSMLIGVHLKTSPSNVAPRGPESIVTVTSSPSGSNALTVKLLSTPSVALSTDSTVIFGLALAAVVKQTEYKWGVFSNADEIVH